MELLELLLAYLASLQAPLLDGFLTHWPRSPQQPAPASSSTPDVLVECPLSVLRCLPTVVANAPPAAAALVSSIERNATRLHWRQTYRRGELDPRFFDNYAWTEFVPATALPEHRQMTCGALLLGPDTMYPQHRHEAEELYVPASGTARWQQGDALWRSRAPGRLIHHASDEPHAMHTGAEPLLAIYLWRSHDVSQSARLDQK